MLKKSSSHKAFVSGADGSTAAVKKMIQNKKYTDKTKKGR